MGSVVMTYGSMDKHLNTPTYGGYSQGIVVTEEFVLRIPPNLNLAAAAPLLCAGITTYSPLRRWKVGTGQKVGIIGLGGLGHMAVKFAHAFGAHVVRRLIPMRRAVNGRLRSAQARPSNGNMRSRARGFFG